MFKSVCGAVVALMVANAAQSQDTVTWNDDVQGWSVAIDRTIDDSCFIISAYEGDVFLRFQFNATQNNIQFIVANINWASLESGGDYDLEVAFGDHEPWMGIAKGYRWNDILPSLVLSVPVANSQASEFMREFTAMDTVRVSYEGTEIANLALSGSRDAVAEMMDCQAAMSSATDEAKPLQAPANPDGEQI